jgi:integrase
VKRRADGRFVKVMEYGRTDGSKYRKWFYAYSEKDLYKQISNYEVEQEAGPFFKEIAADWKEEHYKQIEYTTQRFYETFYKNAVRYFGQHRIKDITPSIIQGYISGLQKKGYASKTITHNLSVVKLILVKAVIDGVIHVSPAEHISVPRGLKKTKRIPPERTEVEKIKASVNEPFGLFAYFILYTGLRKSEALALQWCDIDLVNREIHVTKAWYPRNNKPYVKRPKTEAGKRIVPLLEPLEKILKPGPPDDYIFGFPTGKTYEIAWNKYRRSIGISCTAHQLRHEFVTMLYEAGINEFDAMNIVGHADIATMRNIYTHIRNSRRVKITDILNAKLKEID